MCSVSSLCRLLGFLLVLSTSLPALAYDGVSPDSDHKPPSAPKNAKRTIVTWPGFQVRGGVPRVFVQTTVTPEYEVQVEGKRVTILIRKARLHLRTNRLPLDTRYFNTVVLSAKLVRRKKDVALVIQLKEPRTPTVHLGTSGGYAFLNADF